MNCLKNVAVLACLFFAPSCAKPPLAISIAPIGVPVAVGEKVAVRVSLRNESGRSQTIPDSAVFQGVAMMDGVAPEFVRSTSEEVDGSILRVGVNVCPPQHDEMLPGELRIYDFEWIPEDTDIGKGFLRLSGREDLLRQAAPVPVEVRPSAGR